MSLLLFALASSAVGAVMARHGEVASLRLVEMLEHREQLPFAQRRLSNAVASLAESLPLGVESWLRDTPYGPSGESRWSLVQARFHWGDAYPRAHFAAYALAILCASGAAAVLYSMARARDGRGLRAEFAVVVTLFSLPLLFTEGAYFYDFPDLLLAAVATYCVLARRWVRFVLVVGLATANKETAVLWALWPCAFGWRDRRAMGTGLAAGVVALAVLWGLRNTMGSPGATSMEMHLGDNLRFLLSPTARFGALDFFAPAIPFPRPTMVLLLVPVALVLPSALRLACAEGRAVERNLLFLAALPLGLAWLVGGYLDEFRVFIPALPAAFLVILGVLGPGHDRGDGDHGHLPRPDPHLYPAHDDRARLGG